MKTQGMDYGQWLDAVCRTLGLAGYVAREALAGVLFDRYRAGWTVTEAADEVHENLLKG